MGLLYINVVGLNGSGKSYLSKKLEKELGLNRIGGDEFRKFVTKNIEYFRGLETPMPYPTDRGRELNPLIHDYRLAMGILLLDIGQSVIIDGSGATRKIRKTLLDTITKKGVTSVIIHCDTKEKVIEQRLSTRHSPELWKKMHHEIRKPEFQPPTANEADRLFVYDGTNYTAIRDSIKRLLDA